MSQHGDHGRAAHWLIALSINQSLTSSLTFAAHTYHPLGFRDAIHRSSAHCVPSRLIGFSFLCLLVIRFPFIHPGAARGLPDRLHLPRIIGSPGAGA